MNTFKKNGGFTLVELIIVIAILAILSTGAIAGYSAYIKSANDAAVEAVLSDVYTSAVLANATSDAITEVVVEENNGTWTITVKSANFAGENGATFIDLFAGIGGMLLSGWMTDRLFAGRAPRLCAILMLLTAVFLVLFCAVSSPVLSSSALILAGFMLYGPQALTGVSATNLSSKSLTGTAIGFISLFSYIGVSVSGKMCGSLAQSSGGWSLPVYTMAVTSVVGMAFFATLWRMPACRSGD